jgi:hypothetical protein
MDELLDPLLRILMHALHALPWLAGASLIYWQLQHQPALNYIALNLWLWLIVYLMFRYADRPLSKWFGEDSASKAVMFSFFLDVAALFPAVRWEVIVGLLTVKLVLVLYLGDRHQKRQNAGRTQSTPTPETPAAPEPEQSA